MTELAASVTLPGEFLALKGGSIGQGQRHPTKNSLYSGRGPLLYVRYPEAVHLVDMPDPESGRDVDTWEDFEQLRY